ncbi:O-antigen ligase family protein [Candidatus Gracilibacteria bacterium]|nr:O-antigen ligase family protein [Candidatus Gracilibacteria bacterium]
MPKITLKEVIKVLILSIVLIVPIIIIPQVHLTFELPKALFFRVGTILAVFATIAFFIKNQKISFPKFSKKFSIFLILYFLSLVISTLLGISPHTSFFGSYERQQGLLQLIMYILFFLVFVSAFSEDKTKKPLHEFIEFISLVAFFIASLAVAQKFLPTLTSLWNTDILVGRNSIGTLGNPNFLGSYIAISLPFFYFNFKNSQNKILKTFWIIAIAVGLTAILFSASRAAILGVIVGIIFYSIIKNKKLLFIPIIISVFILIINIFAHSPIIKNTYFLSRLTFTEEITGSIKSRMVIWPATIKMIMENPIFGYGPENFEEAFSKFSPKELLMTERFIDTADRAHNEILDVTSMRGLFGLLSYLTFLIYMIYTAIKSKSEIALISSTAIISLFAANMFGFSTTAHYLLFWVFAGLIAIESFPKTTKKIPKLTKFTKIFLIISSILIAIKLLFSLFINPLIADYYFDKGIYLSVNFETKTAAEYFKKAVLLNPNETNYALKAGDYSVISKDKENADWFFKKAEKNLHKDSIEILYLGARVDALNKNYKASIEKFKKAYEKAKTSPTIILPYARTLFYAKEYEESLKIYEEYLNLVPIWKNAAATKTATQKEKDQFRIFFKNAPQFITAIEETANVAGMLNDTVKYTYYKTAEMTIKNILKEITN